MLQSSTTLRRLRLCALLLMLMTFASVPARASTPSAPAATATYTNPLPIAAPGRGNGTVESCADPTVFRSQTVGDAHWYLFCTKDPLNDLDRNGNGDFNFHNLPMNQSLDLVNWTYVGDAFPAVPAWAAPNAGLFAPEVVFVGGLYYLYYAVTDATDAVSGAPGCTSDAAIGVATSASPTGPWTDLGRPVVEPRYNGDRSKPFGSRDCNFFATIDPDVITAGAQRYIYFGSYYGGVLARSLSADGLTALATSEVQITIPNRYEGAEIQLHDGFYYLFVSAANCCNGPLTGYSVFAGRSQSPLGPFVDQQGVSLLDARVGGSPVIQMNGNRWVGPGHNSVFTDVTGQTWSIYHAISRITPYFADPNPQRINKRPALLDPIDYVGGWPVLRGGFGPSDTPQPGPAAQPGDQSTYLPTFSVDDQPGLPIASASDEFSGTALDPRWTFVRPPATGTYSVTNGVFSIQTQDADLYVDNNSASVLTTPAPAGEYVVETKVTLNVPSTGCCFNYRQAGLVIYGDDDNYIKLSHVSIFETRQTEFAKELGPVPAGFPRYGNGVAGPPSDVTYLRIVKRLVNGEERYTAYTSRDGVTYVRGGTWTHQLGATARIGLVAMGGAGFTATFDFVHLNALSSQIYLPIILR